MERAVFVYTTYPSIVEAEEAGRALVERRLCACVNILPGMISLYWWQGKVDRGEEVVMTWQKPAPALPRRCAPRSNRCIPIARRPYSCLPIESVDPDYHAWIVAEARGEGTS